LVKHRVLGVEIICLRFMLARVINV
jgi:hypothetical protein